MKMKRILPVIVAILICLSLQHAMASDHDATKPQYAGDKLVRPDGYREWIYLSSGLGMNYNAAMGGPELFTNVFVAPWAYQEFVTTGKWPEKSIFVVEDRAAQTKGSINKTGHFQTDFEGMAVEVKDSSRFPDKWAYFGFGADTKTAEAMPKAACWQCHEDHAAVEHSFVQFYPTLKPVAEKFGSYRREAENVEP
jgi:Cytochrome P460